MFDEASRTKRKLLTENQFTTVESLINHLKSQQYWHKKFCEYPPRLLNLESYLWRLALTELELAKVIFVKALLFAGFWRSLQNSKDFCPGSGDDPPIQSFWLTPCLSVFRRSRRCCCYFWRRRHHCCCWRGRRCHRLRNRNRCQKTGWQMSDIHRSFWFQSFGCNLPPRRNFLPRQLPNSGKRPDLQMKKDTLLKHWKLHQFFMK